MSNEIEHLDSISSFYAKGDAMDELMMDREIDLIKRYPVKEQEMHWEIGLARARHRGFLRYSTFGSSEVVMNNI